MAKNLAQQRREEIIRAARTSALSLEGFTQRVWPILLGNLG